MFDNLLPFLFKKKAQNKSLRTFFCKDKIICHKNLISFRRKKIYISLIHFLLISNQRVEIIKNRVYLHGIASPSAIQSKAMIKHIHESASRQTQLTHR